MSRGRRFAANSLEESCELVERQVLSPAHLDDRAAESAVGYCSFDHLGDVDNGHEVDRIVAAAEDEPLPDEFGPQLCNAVARTIVQLTPLTRRLASASYFARNSSIGLSDDAPTTDIDDVAPAAEAA